MRVYDGESLKETDPRARSIQEYRDAAGPDEGMDGVSTRFAFKVLAATFNHDTTEIAADPVHLMYVLEQSIRREQLPEDTEKRYLEFIKGELAPRYAEFIGNEIQKAYLESYSRLRPEPVRPLRRLCRRLDRGPGLQGPRHRPVAEPRAAQPGADQDRKAGRDRQPQGLPQRGGEVQPAARANNNGKNPSWTSYEKIRDVIEKRMFSQVEELLPVISFGSKKDSDTEKKHGEFVERMAARGYTERQVRRLVEWYMRVKQAG